MISKDGDSMGIVNKYVKFLIIWNFAFIYRLDPSWFNFRTTDVFYIFFIFLFFQNWGAHYLSAFLWNKYWGR